MAAMLCVVAPVCAGSLGAQRAPVVARTSAPTDAWLFSYATVVRADGRSVGGGDVTLDVAVRNGMVRVMFRGGAMSSLTGARGVLLLRAGDTLMTAVNHEKREVLVMPAGQLGNVIGGMQAAGLPLDVSGVSSTVRRGGAGLRFAGHTSQRVLLEQQFTITVGPATMRRAMRTTQHLDVDVSASLSRLDPGFEAFAEQVVRSSGVPAAVGVQLRASQRGLPAGFPVRSVTAGRTVVGADTLLSSSESRISALRRDTVDTMSFIPPRDYRVTELSRLLQPRRPQ
jgi:hypothetical protein